jgi:hypothetical protein
MMGKLETMDRLMRVLETMRRIFDEKVDLEDLGEDGYTVKQEEEGGKLAYCSVSYRKNGLQAEISWGNKEQEMRGFVKLHGGFEVTDGFWDEHRNGCEEILHALFWKSYRTMMGVDE